MLFLCCKLNKSSLANDIYFFCVEGVINFIHPDIKQNRTTRWPSNTASSCSSRKEENLVSSLIKPPPLIFRSGIRFSSKDLDGVVFRSITESRTFPAGHDRLLQPNSFRRRLIHLVLDEFLDVELSKRRKDQWEVGHGWVGTWECKLKMKMTCPFAKNWLSGFQSY